MISLDKIRLIVMGKIKKFPIIGDFFIFGETDFIN